MNYVAPRVLFDCDPGIDDTLALLYLAGLHRAGEIELVGVTTTAGNVTAAATARNATWILGQCGIGSVPVAQGLPMPAVVSLVTTPETHGEQGMGYLGVDVLGECAEDTETEDWRVVWRRASEQDAHLIVTGPLTNLAAEPNLDWASVSVMGGAVNYPGNTTPTAEWNFWVDPHAARDVFAARPEENAPITLCSLGLTERFLVTPARLDDLIGELGAHPIADHLPELLRFYFEFHEAQGEGYQAQIHDALTAMVALGRAQAVESYPATLAVEAESELFRGTCAADTRGHWERPRNCRVVSDLDFAAAHEELRRGFRLLGAAVRST